MHDACFLKVSTRDSSSDPSFAVDVGTIQVKNCSCEKDFGERGKVRRELTEDVQASAFLVVSQRVLPDEAVRAGFQVSASVIISGGVVLNWQPGGLY